MSGNDARQTKNDRRAHAREAARARAEAERRKRLRNRWFLQGGIGAAIVVIAVVIVLVVVNVNNGATKASSNAAGPANMITGGIVFHGVNGKVVPETSGAQKASASPSPVATSNADGATAVTTYIDWACPVCKQFESTYSPGILKLVKQGKATLAIHPVSILDRNYQNSKYATRAANAAACVANDDPDDFLAVQNEFYDNQPEEGSNGLTDTQIKALVKKGGATDPKIATCIDSGRFEQWVTATTNGVIADKSLINASSGGFGTPTVLINGTMWDEKSNPVTDIANAAR
jgi:protein-disulfide isomerase